MIDFDNALFIKLSQVSNSTYAQYVDLLLTAGEEIITTYKGIRDGVVFTNKRIISINVQGITGSKKDFTILPYSKIQAFSVETAGSLDLDGELDLYFSGLGHVRFEFARGTNMAGLCAIISEHML